MDAVYDFYEEVVTRGDHGVIFCSLMQLPDWYKNQSSITETEEEADDVDPEINKHLKKKVLTVDQSPLKVIRARGN